MHPSLFFFIICFFLFSLCFLLTSFIFLFSIILSAIGTKVDDVEIVINMDEVEMKTARSSGAGNYSAQHLFIKSYLHTHRHSGILMSSCGPFNSAYNCMVDGHEEIIENLTEI